MRFATDREVSAKDSNDDREESGTSFNYLLNLPIYSLTKERVDELRSKITEKQA